MASDDPEGSIAQLERALAEEQRRLEKLWDAYEKQEGDLNDALDRINRLEAEVQVKETMNKSLEDLLGERDAKLRELEIARQHQAKVAAEYEPQLIELNATVKDQTTKYDRLLSITRDMEDELNLAFDLMERADRDLAADVGVFGIISGAGVTMATCDMLVDLGARVRCVIDLGGGPIGNREGMVPVFRAVAALEPRVTFINAYLHSSLADDFARALVKAHGEAPLGGRVLLRLLGRNAEEGRRILAPLGFELHEGLVASLEAVVGAARAAA